MGLCEEGKDQPTSWQSVLQLAENEFNAGKFSQAVMYYRQAIELPNSQLAADERRCIGAHMQLGYCYISLDDPSQASPCFSKACEMAKGSQYDLELRSLLGIALTQILQSDGNQTARAALRNCPNFSDLCAAVLRELKGPMGKNLAFGDLLWHLAEDFAQGKEFQRATNFYGYAKTAYSQTTGPSSSQVAQCIERQSTMDVDPGVQKIEETSLLATLEALKREEGPFGQRTLDAHLELARHYIIKASEDLRLGRGDEALDVLIKAFDELTSANSIIPPAAHSTQYYVSQFASPNTDTVDPSVRYHKVGRMLSDSEYTALVASTLNMADRLNRSNQSLFLTKALNTFIAQRGDGTREVTQLREYMSRY